MSSAAHVACAALGDVRAEQRKAAVPPNATFEVRCCLHPALMQLQPFFCQIRLLQLMGLDYSVNEAMHP